MALAIISMIAAVAIFNLSGVVDAGRQAASLRNAQQFCQTYAAAKAAGAQFSTAAAAGILDELIQGKKGRGQFAASEFRLPVADEEKTALLKLCEFDPMTGNIELRNH